MENLNLETLYATHKGKVSDKWSLYLNVYNRLFSSERLNKIRLLEIGVQNGGSLEIWSEYFKNAEFIIGCDVNTACRDLKYSNPKIHLFVGDANAIVTREEICKKYPSFSLIIDDGSHKSSDIIRSFAMYFSLLDLGGTYIIEDLHCSYWKPFEGGLLNPHSSIEFFKRLVDIVNSEHWASPLTVSDFLKSFEKKYLCKFSIEDLSTIHSIEFINSMCIIRKKTEAENKLGIRLIAGEEALINTDILKLKNQKYLFDVNLIQSTPLINNLFMKMAKFFSTK